MQPFIPANGNGGNPYGPLLSDVAGNLYGTALTLGGSGSSGKGVVFKLTSNGSGGYTYSNLHLFTGVGTDGAYPYAGLVSDSAGNLYGTTANGGTSGQGVVFQLTPTGNGYNYSTLYSFSGGTDGANPYASLVLDSTGHLYGTTVNGGASGKGVAFKLSP